MREAIEYRRRIAESSSFCKRLDFTGIIVSGKTKSEELHVQILYSETNEFRPFGLFFGVNEQSVIIAQFMGAGQRPVFVQTLPDAKFKIQADIHILSFQKIYREEDSRPSVVSRPIGIFDIFDLTLNREVFFDTPFKKRVSYIIDGPDSLWFADAIRTISYTGKSSIKHLRKNLPLDKKFGLICEITPHFYHQNLVHDGKSDALIAKKKISLTFIDNAKSPENILERTDLLAERLCLFVSFLSKADIKWYSRIYMDSTNFIETIKCVENRIGAEIYRHETPIPYEEIRPFLSNAVRADFELLKRNTDIRIPILMYVYAQDAFPEDQVINLFIALEKLLELFYPKNKRVRLLSDEEMSLIKKSIIEIIKDEERVEAILTQCEQLRWPGFLRRLRMMLQEMNIKISDLGNEKGIQFIYRIRNALVHKSAPPEFKDLLLARAILQTLIERIVFSVLNWNGKIRTPTYSNDMVINREFRTPSN